MISVRLTISAGVPAAGHKRPNQATRAGTTVLPSKAMGSLPRITRSHPGENPINEINSRRLGGHKRSGVCEQCQQRHLPDERALARHVGAGDQSDLLRGGVQVRIVGHKPLFNQRDVQNRVTPIREL